MFRGSGSIRLDPVYPGINHPIPAHLCPNHEADVKYLLFEFLREYGECYCEVTLSGREQIDLVWVEAGSSEDARTVGIEVKTSAEFDRTSRELASQVKRYRETTIRDLKENVSHVVAEEAIPSEDVYMFDEVWVVTVGGHDRWTLPWRDDTPEDGWLRYDTGTGRLDYQIDALPNRETISIDLEQRVGEAQLTAELWNRYRSPETLVAAESWISEPQDRVRKEGTVKFRAGKGQSGKKKDADLSLGKRADLKPLTGSSKLRGIEVKTAVDTQTRARLREQLPVYVQSGMYSEVYLAVPESVQEPGEKFLKTDFPEVGLMTVTQEESLGVSIEQSAKPLSLQKVPISYCPGEPDRFVTDM